MSAVRAPCAFVTLVDAGLGGRACVSAPTDRGLTCRGELNFVVVVCP